MKALATCTRTSATLGLAFFTSFLILQEATGGSASWQSNPASGDWHTAANWIPHTVPNGPSDTATFGKSAIFDISLSPLSVTEVDGIVYSSKATGFLTTVSPGASFNFNGAGVTNNSGIFQQFDVQGDETYGSGTIKLLNNASAGVSTVYRVSAGNPGGSMIFSGASTAGSAMLGVYGRVDFLDSSSAGTAFFTSYGSYVDGEPGGVISFFDNSKADGTGFIVNSGGFYSRPGSAVYFNDNSSANDCYFEFTGNGSLDISGHNPPGVSVGVVLGSGNVFLGSNNLTVGTYPYATFFSGSIHDGGASGGRGGSLTKVGDDSSVTLHGANYYTGGTVIEAGTFFVNNQKGSATGSGPLRVTGGKLGGFGAIAGAVTIGSGSGSGPVLAPGNPGTIGQVLTIKRSLTFNPNANYSVAMNTSSARLNKVVAGGVRIKSGAQVVVLDAQSAALPDGTSWSIIENTATTPIFGTFSNLVDGTILTIGVNSFRVSYEGGDGNDLTLTVVP